MSAKQRFKVDIKTAFRIFNWGVDVGLLFAEQEREKEEWAEAWKGYAVARRTGMPSHSSSRRQLHSEKWFAAKRASFEEFKDFLAEVGHEANN